MLVDTKDASGGALPPAAASTGQASSASGAQAQAARRSFDDDEGYGIDSYQSGSGTLPPPYTAPPHMYPTSTSARPPPVPEPAGSSGPSVSRTLGPGVGPTSRPVGTTAYSSSQGWSISNLCWAAWCLPPFSSVLLLIYETENDLARFHGYQAGVCGIVWIVIFWLLRSWLGWKSLSIIFFMAGLGWFWVCGSAAAHNAPALQRVPYIVYAAPLAEEWLGQE